MKITTILLNGCKRLAAVSNDQVIDLNAAYLSWLQDQGAASPRPRADAELPSDLLRFVECGEDALNAARRAVDHALNNPDQCAGSLHRRSAVRFTATHRPPKIVCTGNNYKDYRKLLQIPASAVPLLIFKSPTAVIGHEETIFLPEGHGPVYHEWEFSCVISKRCRNVSRQDARDVIYGYTILDDLTGRSFEATNRELKSWGKNMDTFAPMGPWIVTADEMPHDLYNLKTTRRRNGIVECESNTGNMDFGFEEIIEFVTAYMTLEPGDVITTSTPPAGPIVPGDLIEAEIEGIGILRNPVKALNVDLKYVQKVQLKLEV